MLRDPTAGRASDEIRAPRDSFVERASRPVQALLRTRSPLLPLAVVVLNLGLTLFTGLGTLRNFPNSGDEYAYLISAQLYAEGRLAVPSPEPRASFALYHVISDGRFYGRYPPGWPAILSLGVLAGVPWLVNPLLGLLAQLVIYLLALENFSRESANAALLATVANPLLIFNSASYFSHPACLLACSLLAWASLRCLRTPAARLPYLAAGASLGAAFVIRPYTALAMGVPFVGWLLVDGVRKRRLGSVLKGLSLGLVPLLAFVASFLLYDALQTGDPLLPPFLMYDPRDRPFLFHWGWLQVLAVNGYALIQLAVWIPLSIAFLAAALWLRETRRDPHVLLLVVAAATLFVAYAFFHAVPGNRYGPRYLYESACAVFVVIGCVLSVRKQVGAALLAAIVGLNAAWFVSRTLHHGAQVRERMNLYDLVAGRRLTDAVVFVRSGPAMEPLDMTRNGIRFDQPVLYVLDLGARNAELLRAYPGRRAYVYDYDQAKGSGHLEPYVLPPDARSLRAEAPVDGVR